MYSHSRRFVKCQSYFKSRFLRLQETFGVPKSLNNIEVKTSLEVRGKVNSSVDMSKSNQTSKKKDKTRPASDKFLDAKAVTSATIEITPTKSTAPKVLSSAPLEHDVISTEGPVSSKPAQQLKGRLIDEQQNHVIRQSAKDPVDLIKIGTSSLKLETQELLRLSG